MKIIEIIIRRLDLILKSLLDILIVALSGAILFALIYAVFSRFVLNNSVSWGEELPAHLLAMLTFIGAAYLTRTNEHLGFDGVVRILPSKIQKIVFSFSLLLMAIFGGFLAYYGFIAAHSFWGRMLISVDLPVSLFRASVPFCGVLISTICVVRILGLWTGLVECKDLMPEGDE